VAVGVRLDVEQGVVFQQARKILAGSFKHFSHDKEGCRRIMPFQNPGNLRDAGKGLFQPDSLVIVGFKACVQRVRAFNVKSKNEHKFSFPTWSRRFFGGSPLLPPNLTNFFFLTLPALLDYNY